MQDVLVAFADVQGLLEVGPVPRCLSRSVPSKRKGVAGNSRLFRLYQCYNEILLLFGEKDHIPTNQMSQIKQPKAKKVILQ